MQFSSYDLALFVSRCDFEPAISSPEFARPNSFAEKGIQIVKPNTKTEEIRENVVSYRSTPLEGVGRQESCWKAQDCVVNAQASINNRASTILSTSSLIFEWEVYQDKRRKEWKL